jgi:hypothetical protein
VALYTSKWRYVQDNSHSLRPKDQVHICTSSTPVNTPITVSLQQIHSPFDNDHNFEHSSYGIRQGYAADDASHLQIQTWLYRGKGLIESMLPGSGVPFPAGRKHASDGIRRWRGNKPLMECYLVSLGMEKLKTAGLPYASVFNQHDNISVSITLGI